jgi:hypothetical protein
MIKKNLSAIVLGSLISILSAVESDAQARKPAYCYPKNPPNACYDFPNQVRFNGSANQHFMVRADLAPKPHVNLEYWNNGQQKFNRHFYVPNLPKTMPHYPGVGGPTIVPMPIYLVPILDNIKDSNPYATSFNR